MCISLKFVLFRKKKTKQKLLLFFFLYFIGKKEKKIVKITTHTLNDTNELNGLERVTEKFNEEKFSSPFNGEPVGIQSEIEEPKTMPSNMLHQMYLDGTAHTQISFNLTLEGIL